MKTWKHIIILTAFVLAVVGCELGTSTGSKGNTATEDLSEVTGTLVLEGGIPAAGAQVRAYPVDDTTSALGRAAVSGRMATTASSMAQAADSAMASSTGAFTLTKLPPGTYNISATIRRGDTTYAIQVRAVITTQGVPVNIGTLALQLAGSISLQILAGDVGVPGARCFVAASPWEGVADSTGLCVITGVAPGSFQVRVSAPGFNAVVTGTLTITPGQPVDAGPRSVSNTPYAPPLAPTLLQPGQFATNIPLTPGLKWAPSAGATGYRVQVSTNAAFSSFILNDSMVTGDARNIGPLAPGAAYYWRVAARNAAGTGPWSPVRTFNTLANDSLPGVPQLQSPAPGATGIALTPSLVWGIASRASAYQLQLATDSAFTQITLNDTLIGPFTAGTIFNRTVGPLTANKVYFWRMRASNAAGTGSWSPIRKFTTSSGNDTTVAGLAAPTLAAPAHNAVDLADSVNLTWGAVSGATGYDVHLSPDTLLMTSALKEATTNALMVRGLAKGSYYSWRVRAKNASGFGPFSAVRYFRTKGQPADSVPGAPTLTLPSQFSTGVPLSVSLTWNAAARATLYRAQVSTSSNFATLVLNDSNVTATARVVSGLAPGTDYYWRVQGRNSKGSGAFSTVFRFTTGTTGDSTTNTPPATPTLLSPAQFATGIAMSPVLSWNTVPGAMAYRVQLSTSSSFTSFVLNDSNVTANSRTVAGLAANTQYFWRVSARNASGTSAFSEARRFTTGATAGGDSLPGAVLLSLPAWNATNVGTSPTLTWTVAKNATSYEVQVSTNISMGPLFLQDTVTGTSRGLSGLGATANYYWRVRGRNNLGAGTWSSISRFFVASGDSSLTVPSVPNLVSPTQFATSVSVPATLTWAAVSGAASYRLEVSANSAFPSLVFSDSSIIGTSRSVSGLALSTDYYWRVRAKNASGSSAFSSVFRFTTGTGSSSAWTVRTSGATVNLNAVASGSNRAIAVGDAGTILRSTDGITWSARSSGTTAALYAVARSNTLWVTVGANGTILTAPSDTSAWTTRTSGTTNALYGVAWTGSQYVAVGAAGTLLTSTDGATWTARTSGTTQALYAVSARNAQLLAAGANGTLLSSTNAITWTQQVSGTTSALYSVHSNDTLSVATGAGGTLITSPNGTTWTTQTSGTTSTLYAVTKEWGVRTAVGAGGVIVSSPTGTTWSTVAGPTGFTSPLYGITWMGNRLVAVGGSGSIVTSQ